MAWHERSGDMVERGYDMDRIGNGWGGDNPTLPHSLPQPPAPMKFMYILSIMYRTYIENPVSDICSRPPQPTSQPSELRTIAIMTSPPHRCSVEKRGKAANVVTTAHRKRPLFRHRVEPILSSL